ncbi:MAG: type ISP restriction/modification enzyme, partial [Anaerolineae bacterium]
EIYVLDLHGNSLKRETAPAGSQDKNVFDIRQGVAIAFFVKHADGDNATATVFHADLWGLRDHKYKWLHAHDTTTTDWQEINPKSKFYLFVPRDEAALDRYNQFAQVTDLFPVHSLGIVTSRDSFAIDLEREALKRRIRTFCDPSLTDDMARKAFKLRDNRDWKLAEKRREIQQDGAWEDKITRCLYRPFDDRWLFYHYHAIDFGRETVMRHMLTEDRNIALVTCRQLSTLPWAHAFVSGLVTDNCMISNRTRERGYHFPLYLYPDIDRHDLFSLLETGKRRPNLDAGVVGALAEAYGEEPVPEDTFYYVYAVLYAPSYREKYAEFLKIDFPRVPFTTDHELFSTLAGLGRRLADLHLLRSDALDPPSARFHGEGDNRVARIKSQGFAYDPRTERVHVNRTQYFAPVPQEVWEYQIGGYQVAEKWLKDRKDRELGLEEIKTYCHVMTAIQHTIALQEEIDALYPEAESEIVEMH